MKKPILIIAVSLTIVTFAILLYTIILSFKVVKQTTDKINVSLLENFQSLVRFPQGLPPETKSLDKTTYVWEMETTAGEISKVRFAHDTAFSQSTNKIVATFAMEPGGDPSVFEKVLPAVIADKQTIISVTNLDKVNLNANPDVGYNKIAFTKSDTGKIIKIEWEFNKEILINKNQNLYTKIYNYPPSVLKGLYQLQRIILTIFSA